MLQLTVESVEQYLDSRSVQDLQVILRIVIKRSIYLFLEILQSHEVLEKVIILLNPRIAKKATTLADVGTVPDDVWFSCRVCNTADV